MVPSEIAHSTAASSSNAARSLFDELSKDSGEWVMKIGDPAEVRYSDSILHIWTIMELLTLHRPAGCSYVEIMGRGGCYSRYFSGESVIVLGARSSVPVALFEAARAQSLEIKALKEKEASLFGSVTTLSLELF